MRATHAGNVARAQLHHSACCKVTHGSFLIGHKPGLYQQSLENLSTLQYHCMRALYIYELIKEEKKQTCSNS